MNLKSSRILNPLRQCESEVKAVLNKKDLEMGDPRVTDLRQYDRLQYQVAQGLELTVHHPGGTSVTYIARPYNISKGGIGLVHGAFNHSESRCVVAIRMPTGNIEEVGGRVTRCMHITGKIHDVGIQFDHIVDGGWYDDQPDGEEGSDNDLPQFAGKILVVTDSRGNRELLRHMFDRLGVSLTWASTPGESLETLEDHLFDMLFVSIWLGEGKGGLALMQQLRERKFPFAIVGLGADEGDPSYEEAIKSGCETVMPVPQSFDELIPLLKRYLRCTAGDGQEVTPLLSSRWREPGMRRLILAYVDQLDEQVSELRHALVGQNDEAVSRLCEDIKASARGYGYAGISDVAANLLNMINEDTSADEQRGELDELLNLCHQASRIKKTSDSG